MKGVSARFLGVAVLLAASNALAQPTNKNAEWSGDYDVKSERRSDFMAGVSYSLMAATAYGYPNEAEKIDNPRYVQDTGAAPGSMLTLWIGGALRDWFSFGIGATGFGFESKPQKAMGSAFVFRVETFPMFDAFAKGRDLGLYAQFGLGGVTIENTDTSAKADGGAISLMAFGAFYEPIRFSIFSAGPTIEYMHFYSQSLSGYGASAGFRLVLYTGP
jgi:hypothetical protein